MSSFEFYTGDVFAACQYDCDKFFAVLDAVDGTYPLLARARKSLEALNDDVFSYASGEAKALRAEVTQIAQGLNLDLQQDLDLHPPPKHYAVFCFIAQQMHAVFKASDLNKTDIQFRWG